MNWKSLRVLAQSVQLPFVIGLGGLLVAAFAEDNPEPARPPAESQEAHAELEKIRDGINRILEENSRLKEENAQLRKENQQLRRLLAEKAGAGRLTNPAPAPVSGVQSSVADPGPDSALAYWLSTSSGQRHNSRCRYFKTGEGRFCGAEDGKACKLCGG